MGRSGWYPSQAADAKKADKKAAQVAKDAEKKQKRTQEAALREQQSVDNKMQLVKVGARINQQWDDDGTVSWYKGVVADIKGNDVHLRFDCEDQHDDETLLTRADIRADIEAGKFKITAARARKPRGGQPSSVS